MVEEHEQKRAQKGESKERRRNYASENSPENDVPKSLRINTLQYAMAWNTASIKLAARIPFPAWLGDRRDGERKEDGNLFTSYSQGVDLLPAVRRESNFRPESQQENFLTRVTFIFNRTDF